MGGRVFLALILGVCLLSHRQSNHLLRFLTFCQKNITSDKEYEVEFDGDELFYVDPMTYRWTPDPGLDTNTSVVSSLYVSTEVEVHTAHQTVETAVCVGSVTLGVVGVATGVWFIKKAKRSGWALRT
uniref:MHC class II alpha chain N-terminal domain-containing protein n=1 Tax=Oncorhynchus tshawytscha TaxID=74940 RepID=A0A8C8FJH8_ONCTS